MKADNMIEKNGTICENLVTPVSDHAEVVVAGGGIAGIAAALAAARNGADVLLIEAEYALGGLATLGLITMYLPLCDGCGHQVSFGIAEELLRLSVKHGHEGVYPAAWLEGGSDEEKIKTRFRADYNGPLFCIEAERLLLEAGVRILYGTRVCRAVTDGDRITALVVENKSGRYALTVKSVIDATGDADIAESAGAGTVRFGGGNLLAAWYYFKKQGQNDEQVQASVTKLYKNVAVLDSGARGSSTTFAENGQGDVLIAWENEAFFALQEYPGEYEIVVPSASVLCQPTVAKVDEVTQMNGTAELADAYLSFLYTDDAQRLEAQNFYRPVNKDIQKEYEASSDSRNIKEIPSDGKWIVKDIDMVDIGYFGGWEAATQKFFSDGGIFDKIYD